MKHLLSSLALLVLLTGCGKKADDPQASATNPLLGHWQAESQRVVDFGPQGQISHDNVEPYAFSLDVTATSLHFRRLNQDGSVYEDETRTYTLNGETLTLSSQPAYARYFIRGASAQAMTYETRNARTNNGDHVETVMYHR